MAPDDGEIESIKEANKLFYEAFGTLDVEMMDMVCLDSEQAVCIHPGWEPLVGWGAIRASWERIFDNTTLMHFNIKYLTADVRGDCGWVTCVENITTVIQGRASNFATFATNIFLRTESGWKLSSHHGSTRM